jgi:Fur family iron response transcriptional regulator
MGSFSLKAYDMNDAITNRLKKAGLRPTRQRILLARLIWGAPQPRHISAEQLHNETKSTGEHVSLATIYNTLHQLTEVGLLNEVCIDCTRSYFDTNLEKHHHVVNADTGEVIDLPEHRMTIPTPAGLPAHLEVVGMDVLIRVRSNA